MSFRSNSDIFGIVWQSLGIALQKLVCSGPQEPSERESPLKEVLGLVATTTTRKYLCRDHCASIHGLHPLYTLYKLK